MLWIREASWKRLSPEYRARIINRAPINVEVYLPKFMTTFYGDIDCLKLSQKVLDDCVKSYNENKNIPKARWENDVWVVKSMKDAVACEACLWTIEDVSYYEI